MNPNNCDRKQAEESPKKLKDSVNSESPGLINGTPPLRKKKLFSGSCEKSPSLMQHPRRRRKKKLDLSPQSKIIGIDSSFLFQVSPIASVSADSTFGPFIPPTPNLTKTGPATSPVVLSRKKPKNHASPVVCKTKKKIKVEEDPVNDENIEEFRSSLVSPQIGEKTNRALFFPPRDEIEDRISQFQKSPAILRGTQVIDEFDTCAIDSQSPRAPKTGWKSQEKISEILSAERVRRSLCREQLGPDPESSKRKPGEILKNRALNRYFNCRENLEERKRALENERDKNQGKIDAWKDFHVIGVFERDPLLVQASGEEGVVTILLPQDGLKNQNALEPGSILRIYSPWITINDSDDERSELFYVFVSGCDVRCVEGRRLEEKVQLREIAVDKFTDPGFLMRALLGEDLTPNVQDF